jgi:hypothetical protein
MVVVYVVNIHLLPRINRLVTPAANPFVTGLDELAHIRVSLGTAGVHKPFLRELGML